MNLYHFTCEHSAAGIEQTGILVPQMQPLLGRSLVWMTDLEVADRDGLGLTSKVLKCDRTEHRYLVPEPVDVLPWSEYRRRVRPTVAYMLEKTYKAKPEHWFVSEAVQKVEVGHE